MEIQKLKAYQNTTPELNQKGITVSWNGGSFNVIDVDPNTEALDVDKIAKSLARQARYMGHTNKPYSIAQHCCRGAEAFILMGRVEEAKQFLFHDASEALISDLSAPLKRMLGEQIAQIEEAIEAVVAKRYGYQFPYHPAIKKIDVNLAQDEMAMLMNIDPKDDGFDYWDHEKATQQYIYMYNKIEKMLDYQKSEFVKK